jgi:signal recognition particle subunit SRP68
VAEGDARMQDLRVTNLKLNYDLISWRIGRNRVLIGSDDGLSFTPNPPQKPRRPRKDGKEWSPRDEPTGRKLARLRERVALYDAILQSIDSIKALRGAARDADFVAELEAQGAYFQALKCLNLAHAHAFQAAPKNALALCGRALALSGQATSLPPSSSPEESKAAPHLSVSPSRASTLQSTLQNLSSHYRGVVALSSITSTTTSSSSSSTNPAPGAKAKAKATTPNAAPVVERLNEYPATGTVDLGNLVTWPPKLKPVPVKPLFLDVAWNYVGYPGRKEEVKEEEEEKREEMKEVKEVGEEVKVEKGKKGWFGFGR